MTHTLITILGGARGPGYRQATYRFSNGEEDRTTFFGLALARHLHPEVTVILGTAGSQWGVLVEHLAGETSDEEDARLELLSAEEQGAVAQKLLDRLAPLMARRMNCKVRPALIPLGRDEEEQYHILSAIDDAVPKGSPSFDLTHGFRHFGHGGFSVLVHAGTPAPIGGSRALVRCIGCDARRHQAGPAVGRPDRRATLGCRSGQVRCPWRLCGFRPVLGG